MVEAVQQASQMSLKLELKIQGRNVRSEKPTMCTLSEFVNNQWVERGRTEASRQNNSNPDFETGIQIGYFFEKNQIVRFAFTESQSGALIGNCETTLAALMVAKQLKFEGDLVNTQKLNPGKIIVKTDVVQKSNKVYKMEFIWPNCGNVVGKCCGSTS